MHDPPGTPTRPCEAVRATGCPVVWTEDNGGHWIVGTYDLVATAFRDWETFSSERTRPGPLGDRLHQQQPPAVPPRGERPAALVRLPPVAGARSSRRRRRSGCAAGRGTGPQHALDQVVERGEIEFVHDLTCPVPASVTLEWLGYPAGRVAVVLRHLPRHLRVPRRFARAPRGVEGLRPGAAPGSTRSCATASRHRVTTRSPRSRTTRWTASGCPRTSRSRSRSSPRSAASTRRRRSPVARCCTCRSSPRTVSA